MAMGLATHLSALAAASAIPVSSGSAARVAGGGRAPLLRGPRAIGAGRPQTGVQYIKLESWYSEICLGKSSVANGWAPRAYDVVFDVDAKSALGNNPVTLTLMLSQGNQLLKAAGAHLLCA